MCLRRDGRTELDNGRGVGWKVFIRKGNRLVGEFSGQCVKVGEWLKAEDHRAWMSKLDYTPGFHIFLKKWSADSWCDGASNLVVRKVRYSGAHLRGNFNNRHTVVAKRMRVLFRKEE